MTMIRNKRIIYPVIAGVLACLVVLAGCFIVQGQAAPSQQFTTVDMPIYNSIEELTAASDVVVIGTVKGVFSRYINFGQDGKPEWDGDVGTPAVVYEVEVTKGLKGEPDNSIFVDTIDAASIICEDNSALKDNDQFILFLQERASGDWPNVPSPSDKFYVITSFDNGVFDVLPDGTVKPRMPEAFTAAGCSSCGIAAEEPVFTLEGIRADVQAAQ